MYIPSEKNSSAGSVFSRLTDHVVRGFPAIMLILFMASIGVISPGAPRRSAAPSRDQDRVMRLVIHLAEQARLSPDTSFAVRVQAEAGVLVWPYDRDQARAIFQRGFRQLLPSAVDYQPATTLEIAKRQQLRAEFLSQIAPLDPEMAETLARSFALASGPLSSDRASLALYDGASLSIAVRERLAAESRELLVSVALSLAQVDRRRALALGQLSLEAGISPYFGRLLLQVGDSDPALADLLFSRAVDYLERVRPVSIGDFHTLSFYLISTADTAGKNRSTQPAAVVRFLSLACDLVMRGDADGQAETVRRDQTDRSFQLYCTGKYLMELLPRFLPDRVAQFQHHFAELTNREVTGAAPSISAVQSADPCAIEQAAAEGTDERERDELYARAAFGWLARGDLRGAQLAALKIANAEMRDRVLLSVGRRLMSKTHNAEALPVVRLLQNRIAKTELLIALAQAEFSRRNVAGARTLLNEAEREAAGIESPFARARSLLAVVAGFAAFDAERAFEVTQSAVRFFNDVPEPQQRPSQPADAVACLATAQTEELFQLNFAGSLTALARQDFDRTLLLAQQLTGKKETLIAQLAVCRGGLRADDSSGGE